MSATPKPCAHCGATDTRTVEANGKPFCTDVFNCKARANRNRGA